MLGIKRIISEAEALPVEERAVIVDCLLRTLNAPNSEIDQRWAEVAMRRLEELRSGSVQSIPGEQVLARVRERFDL